MSQDRLKAAFRALHGLDPMHPYRRLYRAKVMAQSADLQKVDVRPYDPMLPDMAGIDLRHGVPGIKVQVTPGCSVQIGWDDGKPDKPFAALWSTEATAVKLYLTKDSDQAAVRGDDLKTILDAILTAVIAHTHVCAGSGSPSAVPNNASEFTTQKAQLDTMLSDVILVK